jgi:hypothetical protein
VRALLLLLSVSLQLLRPFLPGLLAHGRGRQIWVYTAFLAPSLRGRNAWGCVLWATLLRLLLVGLACGRGSCIGLERRRGAVVRGCSAAVASVVFRAVRNRRFILEPSPE